MSRVEVRKVPATADRTLPIFAEFEKVADRIRTEAFNLFNHRGAGDGHALDDWLTAEREFCWPAAELTEANGSYAIKVALAGFEPGEIEVTATPREVMIKAAQERQNEGPDEDTRLQWTELHHSDVYRRIELPDAIDVDRITASLKNGMLAIMAPKAESTRQEAPRKIKLSTPS
jgi:HSP20 family molecular chaperone IbpA